MTFAPAFKRVRGSVFVCVLARAVFPCQSARLHGSTSQSVYSMSKQSSIQSLLHCECLCQTEKVQCVSER